jgi:hypothetical protein
MGEHEGRTLETFKQPRSALLAGEASGWTRKSADSPRLIARIGRNPKDGSAGKEGLEGSVRRHGQSTELVGIEVQNWAKPNPLVRVERKGGSSFAEFERTLDYQFGVPELQPRLIIDANPCKFWLGKLERPTAVS